MTEHRKPQTGPPKARVEKPKKVRADQLVVERGLAETRSRAQALILAGEVFTEEQRVEKAGQLLLESAPLRVREPQRFVSRGGLKLEGALNDLQVDPAGCIACDVGASTGGFTDCLLQHGAERVYAVDVGHGQLAERLRRDPRVVVMERTNARHLTPADVEGGVDLVVVDASFISLAKLLPAIAGLLRPSGRLLALIKPQFEVGRDEATRTAGVIRDRAVRRRAIDDVLAQLPAFGLEPTSDAPCRIRGPKGNVEHFSLSTRRKGGTSSGVEPHSSLPGNFR